MSTEVKKFKPYQQRVADESIVLGQKLRDLRIFIDENAEFKNLSVEEQRLLIRQDFIMSIYLSILNDRIAFFADGAGMPK